MNPDFYSIDSDDDEKACGPVLRMTPSAGEVLKRKRERDHRKRGRAMRNVAWYASYVACIALTAGFAQLGTAFYVGLPLDHSVWSVVRTICGGFIGAFVGLAGVCFLIMSPIVPLGPITILRLDLSIADAEREKDESRALRGAGILFAVIGTIIASLTISVDNEPHSAISRAGMLGSVVGAGIAICVAFLRRSKMAAARDATMSVPSLDKRE